MNQKLVIGIVALIIIAGGIGIYSSNVSKKEQKKRFMERIDDTTKNWKFSLADLKERGFWDDYQKAYEEALGETSTDSAPWFVIPADDKWFARLSIGYVIYKEFEKLKLSYPTVSEMQRVELQKAKAKLMAEDGDKVEVSAKAMKPKKSKNKA